MKTQNKKLSIYLPLNFLLGGCVRKIVSFISFMLLPITVVAAQNESVYTRLDEKNCKMIEQSNEGGGWFRSECEGIGGFKLEVTESDLRQSINIISPSGEKFALDFWRISGGFSSVGATAEWRLSKKTPVVLIVRFNVSQSEDPTKTTSYLVVAKISKTAACITDMVKPSKNQNVEARKLADKAQKPCQKFNNTSDSFMRR